MNNDTNSNTPTTPIPITGRHRRSSIASSIPALSTSPTSPLAASIQTPTSAFSQRFGAGHTRSASESSANGGGSSPTSPLAYFLGSATSPIRGVSGAASGFPFGAKPPQATSAIDEDEESPPGGSTIGLFGVGAHARRGSWAQAGFGTGNTANVNIPNDRGTGILRRLSLSSAFQRPSVTTPNLHHQGTSPPPPSAVASPGVPTIAEPIPRIGRKHRAATMGVKDSPKKRGISPMGERLLKGHFDGFI